jgi:hypothetical protein
MSGPGFQEAQVEYAHAGREAFVGQVRRFGPYGPAYEVLAASAAYQ